MTERAEPGKQSRVAKWVGRFVVELRVHRPGTHHLNNFVSSHLAFILRSGLEVHTYSILSDHGLLAIRV